MGCVHSFFPTNLLSNMNERNYFKWVLWCCFEQFKIFHHLPRKLWARQALQAASTPRANLVRGSHGLWRYGATPRDEYKRFAARFRWISPSYSSGMKIITVLDSLTHRWTLFFMWLWHQSYMCWCAGEGHMPLPSMLWQSRKPKDGQVTSGKGRCTNRWTHNTKKERSAHRWTRNIMKERSAHR